MEIAADIWAALGWFWVAIVIFGAFLLGLFILTLWYGPRRGYWSQPAARLRAPGRRVVISMYVFAVMNVLIGIGCTFVPGVGISAVIVAVLMASFYVACAHVMAIASRSPGVVVRLHRG